MPTFSPGHRVYLKTHIEDYEAGLTNHEPCVYEVVSVESAPTPLGSPYAWVAEPGWPPIDVPLARLVPAGE